MKYRIPLNQVPNLEVSVNLKKADKTVSAADIGLRTLVDGSLVMDLHIDGAAEFYGRRCIDRMPMLLNNRLGGNLYFEDKAGTENPDYQKFNDRFVLVYDDEYRI